MSQYEGESGTVTVSEHDWPRVHCAVIKAWNAWQDEQLLQTQRLYAELAARYGGQGETALWREEVERLASRAAAHERAMHGDDEVYWREMAVVAARNALLEQMRDSDDLFPPEPERNWFPHALQNEEYFALGGVSLTVAHASYTLTWPEREGTRNLARARTHPVGIALSQALPGATPAPGMGGYMECKDGSHSEQPCLAGDRLQPG